MDDDLRTGDGRPAVSLSRHLSERVIEQLAPSTYPSKNEDVQPKFARRLSKEDALVSVQRRLSHRAASTALGVPQFESGSDPEDQLPLSVTFGAALDDVASAVAASFLLSVPVTCIDKAVVQNASGVKPLWAALREELSGAVLRPHRFLLRPEFLMVWGVYTGTYIAANLCDSFAETRLARARVEDIDPEEGGPTDEELKTTAGLTKLATTTTTNLLLSATKDRTFGVMFGAGPPRSFPLVSWSLFAVRDVLTMGCAFNLPGPIATYLQAAGAGEGASKGVAQIFPVVLCQFLTTPVHLMSYDLYNHVKNRTMGQRVSFIRGEYAKTVMARSIRIAPAFGFGGLGNAYIRDSLRTARRESALLDSGSRR